MNGVCRIGWLGLALMAAVAGDARAAEGYSEDAVEAAYLYRSAGYVNWPDEASSDAPFTIGVLDSPGVARELQRLLPGHRIGNRVARVREVAGLKDVGNVQILFIGPGHADLLRRMQAMQLDSLHMLIVTAEEGGLEAGSALNFLIIDHRVRFEISLTAADRSGLRISSELLGVAVRVLGGGRQSREGCSPFPALDAGDEVCAPVVALQDRARGPARYSHRIG